MQAMQPAGAAGAVAKAVAGGVHQGGSVFGAGPTMRAGALGGLGGAPAIISGADTVSPAMIEKVMGRAAELKDTPWPVAREPVFKTTPEAYASTTELVPQRSVRDQLPTPLPGEKLPLNARAAPIQEASGQIADLLARDLGPDIKSGSHVGKFYHTGPVIQGLVEHAGLRPEAAVEFMRDWAGMGAATSPRTATPQNLRNASYHLFRDASGNPLTRDVWEAEGNAPGFRQMGMHVDLANDVRSGGIQANKNPKPFVFRENWSGNLQDLTGDTHWIRGVLSKYDELNPGGIPRGWFKSDEAYKTYKDAGRLPYKLPVGDIADTLSGVTRNKVPPALSPVRPVRATRAPQHG
jgi:hypothetical protein